MTKGAVTRAWLLAAVSIAIIGPGLAATRSLSELIDTVIHKGPDSQLPAHLSVVLGVNRRLEKATAIKQAVMRDGALVRTFNVCTAKPDDVVLIAYNEQSHASKAYLVSPAGVLRKAVAFQAGAPVSERSLTEAASDFAIELKFWTDFERQLTVPK